MNMHATLNVVFEAFAHLLVVLWTLGGGVQPMPVPTDVPMCTASEPAHYKLTFTGKWSRSAFPKQYPVYRPPAQWSNIVGKCDSPSLQRSKQQNHQVESDVLCTDYFAEKAKVRT